MTASPNRGQTQRLQAHQTAARHADILGTDTANAAALGRLRASLPADAFAKVQTRANECCDVWARRSYLGKAESELWRHVELLNSAARIERGAVAGQVLVTWGDGAADVAEAGWGLLVHLAEAGGWRVGDGRIERMEVAA